MFDAATQPFYTGSREAASKLSLATRMINIKMDHNYLRIAWMHKRNCLKSICQKKRVS